MIKLPTPSLAGINAGISAGTKTMPETEQPITRGNITPDLKQAGDFSTPGLKNDIEKKFSMDPMKDIKQPTISMGPWGGGIQSIQKPTTGNIGVTQNLPKGGMNITTPQEQAKPMQQELQEVANPFEGTNINPEESFKGIYTGDIGSLEEVANPFETQPQKQGLFSEIGSKLKKRFEDTKGNLKESDERFGQYEKMGIDMTVEKGAQKTIDILGGIMGGVQDIAGTIIGKGLDKVTKIDPKEQQIIDRIDKGEQVSEQELMSLGTIASAKQGLKEIVKTPAGQKVIGLMGQGMDKRDKYKKENPVEARGFETIANTIMTMLDVIGAGETIKTGKGLVQQGIKKAPGMVKSIAKEAPKSAYEIKEGLKEGVRTFKGLIPKSTVDKVKIKQEAKDIVGKIIQGEVADKDTALKVLSDIDTKGIKTYKELGSKLDIRGKELMKGVDKVLDQDKNSYKLGDFLTVTKVGNTEIKQNYVKKGLDQLEELYTKIDDPVELAKIKELKNKFNTEGLGLKEANNIARQYNSEFGKRAFSKTGDPLTSVNAQSYENIRKGIKDSVRNKMPDDTTKLLDKKYSDLSNTKQLIDKMEESVNKLNQKIQKRGLIEKLARGVGRTLDVVTMGGARGLLTSFLPSNIGNKVMNAIDLEGILSNNLKNLNKLISKIDDGTLTKLDIDNLISNNIKNATTPSISNINTNLQQSKQIIKVPQPYSQIGEATYKPNFKMVEKPKALPQPKQGLTTYNQGKQAVEKVGLQRQTPKLEIAKKEVKALPNKTDIKRTPEEYKARAEEILKDYDNKIKEMKADGIDEQAIKNWKAKQSKLVSQARQILGKEKVIRSTKEQMFYKRGLETVKKLETQKPVKAPLPNKSNQIKEAFEKKGLEVKPKALPKSPLHEEARKYKSAEEFVKNKQDKGEIVFHGTPENFDVFDKSKVGKSVGSDKEGIFFTNSKNLADRYSYDPKLDKKGGIIEASIDFKKPLEIEVNQTPLSYFTKNKDKLFKQVKKEGFDGIKIFDKAGDENIIIAINPEQIKTKSQLKQIREEANKGLKPKSEMIGKIPEQLKKLVDDKGELTLYRGTGKSSPKEGNYYSTDKEFAREFTDLFTDEEIKQIKVKPKDIYVKEELPGASNTKEMDNAIQEAKKKGYKAILVDEGPNQPPSVHFIEKVK